MARSQDKDTPLDAWLTLAILVAAAALFISERLRVDVVALMVLSALLVLGLVNPDDALAGFSSEATITVAAMFVLSAGLSRSGALLGLGRLLSRIRNPWLMLGIVLAVVGPVSAFINNTAAVAVFLPLLLAAATASRRAPSKFLIPLSYVAQMGGVCTLIGTSTNLLVNGIAKQAGQPGFTLFEFSELGVLFLAAGVAYLMIAGPFLLPEREAPALPASDEIGKYVTELRVPAGSPLVGRMVADVRAMETHRVYVLELIRGDEKHWAPRSTAIDLDDRLLVQGEWPKTHRLRPSPRPAARCRPQRRTRRPRRGNGGPEQSPRGPDPRRRRPPGAAPVAGDRHLPARPARVRAASLAAADRR